MVQVIVVVREIGKLKPDYSLKFERPEVPRVGSYISIQRPDHPSPFGEDMVVRQVWWRLRHPETASSTTAETEKIGDITEIFVECDPALSPYSSDHWRHSLGDGGNPAVEKLNVSRFSVGESALKKANTSS
jgi:hypothetical protein